MTKMIAMHIYVIKLHKSKSPMILELDTDYCGLKLNKVYINDCPGLTLTYAPARSMHM